jgi:hypothetical protein
MSGELRGKSSRRSVFAGCIVAWRKARTSGHPEARFVGEPPRRGRVRRSRVPAGQLGLTDAERNGGPTS